MGQRGQAMQKRFGSPSAVFAMVIRDGKLMMQKRQNTGHWDGCYDLAATGHVKDQEA